MRRRDILAGAGSLATVGTSSLAAPAIAQGIRHLKMVTDWPESLPGLQASAVRFARTVEAASGGVHGLSKDVVAELGARDELSKKIYASYLQLRNSIADWGEIYGRYLSSRSPSN